MAEAPNPPKGPRLGRITRTVSFWGLLVVMSILLVEMTSNGQRTSEEITWTQFRRQVASRNVATVQIIGGQEGQWAQGDFRRAIPGAKTPVAHFRVRLPVANSQKLLDELDAAGSVVAGKDADTNWWSLLKVMFPWLLIIGFWVFIFRQ